MTKPSLPKGTRDFSPFQMARREYIFNSIKTVFKKYGFVPIETPSMENLSTLTGKYGAEGDQLIFKILNSGNYLEDIQRQNISLSQTDSKALLPHLSEKALRYDLTVPFARYVVMNRNEITFPFKRYQIQPVWRADRPQKGRYREFYQCDADVIGTESLICEAELILMINEVFTKLSYTDYTIKINNRKILSGIAEISGAFGKEADICVAIDKLDKIGESGVQKELLEKGIHADAISILLPIINLKGTNTEKVTTLKLKLKDSEIGQKGLTELNTVLDYLKHFQKTIPQLEIDISLARGLSYYTGAIIEVKANTVQIGSISGGGRYDNLTGLFGLDGVSGVGISFGVDRIYDVLQELSLFPETISEGVKVLITNFDEYSERHSLEILSKLRDIGIPCEIYPQHGKLKKQFSYADAKKIPYVLIIGDEEIKSSLFSLKDMITGEQKKFTLEQVIQHLNEV